jgi:hypothetical protein
MSAQGTKYRFLTPEEVAEISEQERVKYAAERRAFDAEVAVWKRRILAEGRLEVRPHVYLPVPVPRVGRGRGTP